MFTFPVQSKKCIHCILKTDSVCNPQACPDCKTIWWLICWGRVEAWVSLFPVKFDMLNWVPVPWLQGECECRTESMKWWLKRRSCKLLNGIFSIYAVYSCLWVGENDQANKKSNKNLVELWYFVFLVWWCGLTAWSIKNCPWAHLGFF